MSVIEMPRTLITPEQLLRMPDNSTMELVDGEIVEKTVSELSSEIEGMFFSRVHAYLVTNPIAKVYPASLGYQCFPNDPGKVRKPDMTVILSARRRKLADPDPGYMPIIPDLAVEVISPNETAYDVDEKIQEYQAAGFPLIWVAYPKSRTVVVYPLNGHPVIHTATDDLTAEPLLPGFRCKVGEFFPPDSR